MGEIILKLKYDGTMPLECEVITPDTFEGKSKDEISALKVFRGPEELLLSDVFEISGDFTCSKENMVIKILGNAGNVKLIGYQMTAGKIIVEGDAGFHIGCEMKGGEIIVNGNAKHWAGREMEGGLLHIFGNAGDHVGSSYRGRWEGMLNGTIIVEGDAGYHVGDGLVNGKIIVKGNVGGFCGVKQNGGLIYVGGNAFRTLGVEMKGGTIVVCGKVMNFAPGFESAGIVRDFETDLTGYAIPNKLIVFKGDYAFYPKPKGKLYLSLSENSELLNDRMPAEERPIEFVGNALTVVLNTGSTIEEGKVIKGGKKYYPEYVKEAAYCEIHPDDYNLLGRPEKVKVISQDQRYSVVVYVKPSDDVLRRNAFIPRGVWANSIIDALSGSTGSPVYKGGIVYIEPSDDEVYHAEYIIDNIYKGESNGKSNI
ncbi:Formylmethanofuran dehydrogenase [Methanococcus vannielii SB]|uniref:formylmethanofuran dehydrogenase n=1 Tax=Methanococcus vannielii (strain ATCC 35089 / DSM 1224 / JCM 13029 / OCM 148 / SB) TaxID=406327 RepID=A6UST3_METVS|nr:formylmethanofuran dehydrogenase subunit C [Methanococcus vannielii]ABR55555.1 Formylmethanofuran dehydrogenase [Methanococcus vannielii SB]